MITWGIGCSGFYYNHWKGIFYPEGTPKRKWFDFYTEHFNTLELNASFYRFPKLSVFESWYKKSPEDFTFSVKVPRWITHYKQFHETRQPMAQYYKTIGDGLQHKAANILFQLPPKARYSEDLLNRIIETTDAAFQNVVEFRHESWWNEKVYKTLGKHQISFCGISHPTLPDTPVVNTRSVYFRFHGAEELYKSLYTKPYLRKVARAIRSKNKARSIYLYFNNDIGGAALQNARELQKICDHLEHALS